MRAPPHLHQRRHVGPGDDRLDARDEPAGHVAVGLPVEIVEQRRRRHHAHVDIAFAVDELVETPRASFQVRVLRLAEQQRDHIGGACPELAFVIELGGARAVEQPLEFGQPAIERREIRPFVVVAGDDRAEGERLAAQIAARAEGVERALECRAAALRLHEDPCAPRPVLQPRIGFAHCARQRVDPVGQRLGPALARPIQCVRAEQRAHRLPLAGIAKQRQRFAHLPALRDEPRRPCAGGAPLVGGHPLAQLLQQELAEQRVVVVARLRTAAAIGEEVAAIKIFEQARGLDAAGKRDRFRLGDRRRNRRQHEDALVVRLGAVEDLAREILEDRVLAFAQRVVERRVVAAQVLAQQHQRGDPAVALPLDALQFLPLGVAAAEDRQGFLLGAAERGFVDARDPPAGEEPREFRRRIRARENDHVGALRDLFQSLRQRRTLRGRRSRLVKVVEDDGAASREQRKEIAEEPARETPQVLLRLGREQRECRRRLACDGKRGRPHVMDERRRIGVAGVDLVPQVAPVAGLQVACDERRLAGSRRRADPDDRSRRGFVEERVEPRPRQRVVELRPREFGESGRASGQGCCAFGVDRQAEKLSMVRKAPGAGALCANGRNPYTSSRGGSGPMFTSSSVRALAASAAG